MKIEINLNKYVNVRLTEIGLKVFKESFGGKIPEWFNPYIKGDQYTFQLWDLMSIFGSKLYNGAPQMFKDNKIIFKSKF